MDDVNDISGEAERDILSLQFTFITITSSTNIKLLIFERVNNSSARFESNLLSTIVVLFDNQRM